MASIYKTVVEQELANQPTWFRRKDTLLAVASAIVQLGQIATTMAVGAPEWVTMLITVIVGGSTALIHANTKGAITPSMVERLEQAGLQAFNERQSLSEEPVEYALPVDYKGEHRVGEEIADR